MLEHYVPTLPLGEILAPETDYKCKECSGPVSLITLRCKYCGALVETEKEGHER